MEMTKTPAERAEELLGKLSLEEKLHQLTAQMVFDIGEGYDERRDPLCGCYRNPGHFMHQNGKISSPGEVARRINRDVELSMKAQPHAIPPLEHGEALHGAQWGMASIFPQPIGLASTFDPDLVEDAADVIGKGMRDERSADMVRLMMKNSSFDLGEAFSLHDVMDIYRLAVIKGEGLASSEQKALKMFTKMTEKIVKKIKEFDAGN